MPIYSYQALDRQNKRRQNGTVEAANQNLAIETVRGLGLEPITVKEKTNLTFSFIGKPNMKDRVVLSRQLATMISAGVPLLTALTNIGQNIKKPRLKAIVDGIRNNIAGGANFYDSLKAYPDFFNETYCNLVYSGEQSGRLDFCLTQLANQQEREASLIRKIIGAVFYPILVFVAIVGVIIAMMIFFIPNVKKIYEDLAGGVENLPVITKLLIGVSDFTVRWWWLIIITLVGLSFYFSFWVKSNLGQSYLDKLKLMTPMIRTFVRKLYMAQFCRRAELLIIGGVNYVRALGIISSGFKNHLMKKAVEEATEEVKSGNRLSDALAKQEIFLDLVHNMIRIGEDSGSLDDMLGHAAEYYESELESQLNLIITVIQPVMIIVMGIVALGVVVATLLPIYNLISIGEAIPSG